jgi:DNA-binding SARP family transcriptional activator
VRRDRIVRYALIEGHASHAPIAPYHEDGRRRCPEISIYRRIRRSIRVSAASPRLRLMDAFELRLDGEPVEIPASSQRLIGLLAIQARTIHRSTVAGTLWPESSESRAFGNLRSALWRVQRVAPGLIRLIGNGLSLCGGLTVDATDVMGRARRLVDGTASDNDLRDDPVQLTGELLPDWYEDWLEGHRERLRLLGIHALEALSAQLRARGHHAQAVDAAQLAVMREPLRETARRALIQAHLAQGNHDEAFRQLTSFRRLLASELGVEPSPPLVALLVGPVDGPRTPTFVLSSLRT